MMDEAVYPVLAEVTHQTEPLEEIRKVSVSCAG